jgi:hypothetical protein
MATSAPWFFVGGVNADKEPFPPGSTVTVLQDGEHLPGTIVSVPISGQPDYTVVLKDSPEHYLVPSEQLTGEGEPVFHMISVEPNSPVSSGPPKTPEWIQDSTHVTIHHEGRMRRGMLQSTDQGWTFIQRTTSGRTTFTLDMADLPVSWEERLTEGSLELGWQAQARAYHVSAKGITQGIPQSFCKSMETGYPDRRLWMESYVEEAMGLKEQDTYVVISSKDYEKNHSHIQVIPTMNVQTIKKDEVGDPYRAKSRIVALGNFEDRVWEKSKKYAPVLRDASSRAMTSMAVEMGIREKQGDCKNTFVQSYLPKDETIICRPPRGCPLSKAGDLWLLRKTLYGLRRSPYHWYQNIKKIFLGMGLQISEHDQCVFSGKLAPHLPPIYLGLYVDDFKYFSESKETEKLFEKLLSAKCKVDFMGEVSWFLGCKYEWEALPNGRLTVSITQTAKAEDLIETHGMAECNSVLSPYRSGLTIDRIEQDGIPVERKLPLVKLYQSLVGGLLWLQRQSQPDIAAVTHLLAQRCHDPSAGHYEAAKRVLAYLKGTIDRGIRFTQGGSPVCVNVAFPLDDGVYTDANWGPQDASHPKADETICIEDAQSLLGHVVMRMGGPICWGCMRETTTMSLSSCESEIYATNEGTKSALNVRNLLTDLNVAEATLPIPLWNDNRGTVDWTKGVSVSRKLRHINMRQLSVRLYQKLGYVRVQHIEGKKMWPISLRKRSRMWPTFAAWLSL